MKLTALLLTAALTALAQAAPDHPDLILDDFELPTYGNWTVEGTAFGQGPAHGSFPGQMAVTGFHGKNLVNSYAGGDTSTGSLTSPEFFVERHYLTFLIGGGGFPGKTELRLIVDGKTVRTATGPNTAPGGSEALAPSSWDVSAFAGQKARLQIVDEATGGWGHINVDYLLLTDTKPVAPAPLTRELTIDQPYLLFPVKRGAPKQRVIVTAKDATVREFEIELSDTPDWYAHLDVTPWHGASLTVRASAVPGDSRMLELIKTSPEIWDAGQLYREPLRPLLHFSPRRGWNNDPNGLVYANGEYHLFFQHNPYGTEWGNMHWGHAVSPDLVHWQELPIALYPQKYDDMAFSGSAVVDKDNTSGWKKGANDLLVGAYTSTARGECIIYSNDRGHTWTEFEGNPVVRHAGRDPRLLWHAASHQWVMAVYDESDRKRWIAFYTSPDLKAWTYQSHIEGFFECPDLFELPLDGDAAKKKWVLTAASSEYMVGSFDGKTFTPETPKLPGQRGGDSFYAAQTFSNEPKGRVIQIGWERTAAPGMPFNQGMSIPLELSLHTTPDGPRLAWAPAEELWKLQSGSTSSFGDELHPGTPKNLSGNLGSEAMGFVIQARFEPKANLVLDVRGIPLRYNSEKQELTINKRAVHVPLDQDVLELSVYTDRSLFEVFANRGLVYAPVAVLPKADNVTVTASAEGGEVHLGPEKFWKFQSFWLPKP